MNREKEEEEEAPILYYGKGRCYVLYNYYRNIAFIHCPLNYHYVYMIVSFFQWRFLYKYNVVLTRSFSAPMIYETQNFTLAQLTLQPLHA